MAPLVKQYGHDSTAVQAPRIGSEKPDTLAFATGLLRVDLAIGSERDPLVAVGAEQMQLVRRRDRPDALADRGRVGAGDPHNDLASGEFAWVRGDAGAILLPRAIYESLRPDMLDGLHREVEADTARDCRVRNHEILWSDTEDAGRAGRRAGKLVAQLVRPQRHE